MKKQGLVYWCMGLMALMVGGLSLAQAAGRNFVLVDNGQVMEAVIIPSASRSVASGDFNKDGTIDVFVVNGNNETDEVWFNKGNGLFTNGGMTLDVSDGQGVAVGDINRDTWLDVFVTNNGQNMILLNQKDGTFSSLTTNFPTGVNGQAVALGDFNNDGYIDAFVANNGPNTVWFNSKTGGVLNDSGQTLGNENSTAVASVDFDSDGDLDVVVVNGDNSGNKVWFNNGTGAFTTTSSIQLGATAGRGVATGDLNGDNKVDVFIANAGADTIWLSKGNGTFTDTLQALGTDDSYSVALADMDSDGDLDAYVANDGNDEIWLNDGKGIFSSHLTQTDNDASRGVVLANFDGSAPVNVDTDGDNKIDIVLTSSDNDPDVFVANFKQTNKVWLNMDKGQVIRIQMTPAPNGAQTPLDAPLVVPFAADTNLVTGTMFIHRQQRGLVKNATVMVNGKVVSATHPTNFRTNEWVYVTTQSSLGSYTWGFLGGVRGGLGIFPNEIEIANSSSTTNDNAIAMGDIDGNGSLDAFIGTNGANRVLLNSGFGQFTTGQNNIGNEDTRGVALGDLDNDGDLDAFIANYGTNSQVWFNNNGNFTNSGQNLVNRNSQTVALGDLDNDGDLDALVGNGAIGQNPAASQNSVALYNNGQGQFTVAKDLKTDTSVRVVALADFNADGYLDAYMGSDFGMANAAGRFDQIWLNDGKGNLAPSPQVLQGSETSATQAIAVADVNKDNYLDVVVGNNGFAEVWLNNGPKDGYRLGNNSGQAAFAKQKYLANQGLSGSANMTGIALGDTDNDGRLDLLASVSGSNTSFSLVWFNIYDASQSTSKIFSNSFPFSTAGKTLSGVTFSDLDSDGDVDIFFLNKGSDYTRFNQDNLQPIDTNPPTQVGLGNGGTISPNTPITVQFNRAISQATVTTKTFIINGRQGGYYTGTYPTAAVNSTIQFELPPLQLNFFPGEVVVGSLTTQGIMDAAGEVQLPNPYMWQFTGKALTGTGVFNPAKVLTNTLNTQEVALADVDSDQDLDAFIANGNGNNELWINNGQGNYTLSPLAVGSNSQGVVINDFDRDGQADAFLVQNKATQIIYSIAVNPTPKLFSHSKNSVDVAVGDLDYDGDLDAYVANNGALNEVWLNSGTSRNFITRTVGSNSTTSQAVALGDVNGDGLYDAVVVSNGTNEVQIGDSSGNFKYSNLTVHTLGQGNSTDVALADLNGDYLLDVIVTNADEADQIWYNSSGGNFMSNNSQKLTTSSQAVGVADVDADDDMDLYMAINGQNVLWVNAPDSSGTRFTLGEPLLGNAGLGVSNTENSQAVAMGDVDNDGDLDALVGNNTSQNVIWSNIPWPRLAISKVASVLVAKNGESITYTLTITNVGSATANNLVITDKIPLGAVYATPIATFNKTTHPAQLTQLAISQSVKITFRVSVIDTLTDTILNNDYRASSSELTRPAAGTTAASTRVIVPIRGLTFTGVSTGYVSTPGATNLYTFVATANPSYASKDINFMWESSGNPTKANNQVASAVNQQNFSWTQVGTHVITLTVENEGTSAYDPIVNPTGFLITKTILIRQREIEQVTLNGAETGLMGQVYTFTGQVGPSETTPPVTYTWQSSDQTDLQLAVDSLTHTLSYSWTTPGVKVITLTAANFGSSKSVTKTFLVQTPPAQVVITGQVTGSVNMPYTFTALVNPITTTTPLIYMWETYNDLDGVATWVAYTQTNGLTDTAVFSWSYPGAQVITVTAKNEAGVVSTTHTISTTLFDACQVITAATLTRLPVDQVSTETEVQFTTLVTAGDPLSYTWNINGQVLSEEISSTLITQFDTAMTYTVGVTISNDCSSQYLSTEVGVEAIDNKTEPNLTQASKLVSALNAQVGDVLTYTLILRNLNEVTATVTLTDPIPANTVYVVGSARANGQLIDGIPSAGPVIWSGQVISGTPVLVQFAVTVLSITAESPISNVATLTYGDKTLMLAAETRYNEGYTLSINDGALFTNIPTVTLKYGWVAPDDAAMIETQLSNDGGFGAGKVTRAISATTPNPNTEKAWRITTFGHYVLPRLVYARYRDEFGRFHGPVLDDIIYDPVAPTLDYVAMNGQASFRTRQSQTVNLQITAHDDNSGVAAIQVSDTANFATFSTVTPATATVTLPWVLNSPGRFYVRVIDRAGNMTVKETGAISPTALTFSSAITQTVGQIHAITLTAEVSPLTTTLPITYMWQATGQPSVTVGLNSLNATQVFTWSLNQSGVKTITLTAMNIAGTVSKTYTLEVPAGGIFLPIIMRK